MATAWCWRGLQVTEQAKTGFERSATRRTNMPGWWKDVLAVCCVRWRRITCWRRLIAHHLNCGGQ
jgi:hypothetical protein